jgi:diguanylate cyclase (GGDEF)-like protein
VLHHAVMGLAAPRLVFGGAEQYQHPITWALIHGAFILAASVTHMIAWKSTEQQELRDPLTQLPNRSSFVDSLRTRLEATDEPVAVLFVDIDNFKTINDSSGHHVGDGALFHLAQTMAGFLRGDDVVARMGGDEFAVLFPGTAAEGTEAAERLVRALQRPWRADGREVFVTASIGVADTVLARSRDAEDLLRDAGLAMNLAKSSGKNRVVTYTEGIDTVVRERAELARDLRQALALDQLRIHYQPVVRAPAGTLCGVEALLRWEHPEKGLVLPAQFIPLAEESGTIKEIGAWVLRTAAAQVATWQRELPGCEQLELAVNLSPAQLRDPVLLDTVSVALHDSGLAPGCLMLEVTESMLLADLDLARRQLDAARTMGAQVAIDDFGTGYSSLSYLARLPADQVKIDRSFVRELSPQSAASIALVRSIVQMARALDLDVQAEGVEEPGQQEILNEIGCPRSQGYLFSRPLSAEAFEEFAANSARSGVPVG